MVTAKPLGWPESLSIFIVIFVTTFVIMMIVIGIILLYMVNIVIYWFKWNSGILVLGSWLIVVVFLSCFMLFLVLFPSVFYLLLFSSSLFDLFVMNFFI